MSFDTRNNSAMMKRAEQLKRWEESETNREPALPKSEQGRRIKFSSGCVFLAACLAGDKEEVVKLIENGADINTANVDGLTALHQACIDDNLEMVEFLVEHGADINRQDNEGWTPLHATASCGFVSIARYLVEHGADITAVNSDGELAVDLAVDVPHLSSMVEYMQMLVDEHSIDCDKARRAEEETMLSDAKRWLRSDASEADTPHPKTGATALHVAAAKGYKKVLSLLLAGRANVDKQDNDGWTPLHAAAHWGQKEAAEMLVDAMADMDIRNYAGQTCIDVAERKMVKFLEELKANNKRIKRRPSSQNSRISDSIENHIENTPTKFIRVEVKPDTKDPVNEPIEEDGLSNLERITESDETDSELTDSTESSHTTSISEIEDDKPKLVSESVKMHAEGPIDEDAPWRRGSAARTRQQPESPPKNQVPEKEVKSTESDVILRRTQSFENDEKFYQKYNELRARIKANSCPILPATQNPNVLGTVNTPIQNYSVQRSASLKDHRYFRKPVTSPPASPNTPIATPNTTAPTTPTTPNSTPIRSTQNPPPKQSQTNNNNNNQNNNGEVHNKTETKQKMSPGMIFKNFFKSFVPPVRDEESETQRKAHAKRVRETRRSTQGVTLDEIKSAEELVKKKNSSINNNNNTSTESQNTSSTSSTTTATTPQQVSEPPPPPPSSSSSSSQQSSPVTTTIAATMPFESTTITTTPTSPINDRVPSTTIDYDASTDSSSILSTRTSIKEPSGEDDEEEISATFTLSFNRPRSKQQLADDKLAEQIHSWSPTPPSTPPPPPIKSPTNSQPPPAITVEEHKDESCDDTEQKDKEDDDQDEEEEDDENEEEDNQIGNKVIVSTEDEKEKEKSPENAKKAEIVEETGANRDKEIEKDKNEQLLEDDDDGDDEEDDDEDESSVAEDEDNEVEEKQKTPDIEAIEKQTSVIVPSSPTKTPANVNEKTEHHLPPIDQQSITSETVATEKPISDKLEQQQGTTSPVHSPRVRLTSNSPTDSPTRLREKRSLFDIDNANSLSLAEKLRNEANKYSNEEIAETKSTSATPAIRPTSSSSSSHHNDNNDGGVVMRKCESTPSSPLHSSASAADRRPSWRLKFDSGCKFKLEDASSGTTFPPNNSIIIPSAPAVIAAANLSSSNAQRRINTTNAMNTSNQQQSAQMRPVSAPVGSVTGSINSLNSIESTTSTNNNESSILLRRNNNSNSGEDKENDKENENRSALATQAVIQRRRKPKRRSTGVVHIDMDDLDPERQDSAGDNEEKESGNERSSRSRLGSTTSVTTDTDIGDNKSNSKDKTENGELIDYKALWEAVKLENEKLKQLLKKKDEEIFQAHATVERFTNATTKNSLSEIEKRERRAMERKLSEMEEELKQLEVFKTENQRLKEENGALIRVISKLSK